MISDFDKANMADILAGNGDWFTAELLRLIAKADFENKAKIRLGFPEVVQAYDAWMESGDDDD